jgi:hypothetical protein
VEGRGKKVIGNKKTGGLRKRGLILFLGGLGMMVACQSGPSPSPRSDWADVVLHVTGSGSLNSTGRNPVEERVLAIQDAKVNAYQKLEAKILRLKMDDQQSVSELIGKKPELADKVHAFVRGARIVKTHIFPDQRQIEVEADLFLGENFKAALGIVTPKPQHEKEKRGGQPPPREEFFQ